MRLLNTFVPGSQLVPSAANRIFSYRVPTVSEHWGYKISSKLFESHRKILGDEAFGIENSSLEEIFHVLAEDLDEFSQTSISVDSAVNEEFDNEESQTRQE